MKTRRTSKNLQSCPRDGRKKKDNIHGHLEIGCDHVFPGGRDHGSKVSRFLLSEYVPSLNEFRFILLRIDLATEYIELKVKVRERD